MDNLADTVLGLYWFLNFCSDDELDPDVAVKEIENLSHSIANAFSDMERMALQEAAKRSLSNWLRGPDEHGYTPRRLLTSDQREFLEEIAAGHFAGPPDNESDA
ncbi:MAG: hypothetical protein V4858_12165 [Pseudomonadota bacterium]